MRSRDPVSVSGYISQYYPGGKDAGGLSVNEIAKPIVTTLSTGNKLPAPVVLDKKSIPAGFAPDAKGGSIESLTLEPNKYALDLFKSLEGMNVRFSDARVVGAANSYNEMWVTVDPNHNKTKRGGVYFGSYNDPNPARLMVQTLITNQAFPQADVGDTLKGITEGPLDWNQFGGTYAVQAREIGTLKSGGLKPEVTTAAKSDEASLATYNVQNLAPKDPQAKYDRLAQGLINNLRSPDIVALEEIQDNSGAVDDGTVDADKTLNKLTDAIAAAGGPQYEWRQINPENDKDGGQPGGNIRTAYLFNPKRVSFTDRPGGTSTTPAGITGKGDKTALTVSPGRIDPTNSAWNSSRKPLVGEFTFQGKKLFVIANHFASKLGDQGVDSRFQAPTRSSEAQRTQQAAVENAFIKELLAADPKANLVVLGDLNDFQFSPAVQTLTGNGKQLTDLVNTLPQAERYSYVYQGNSQVLDHILVNPAMKHVSYDVVHINSEFADQTSDHEPQVVRVKP
ncbi:endonuclease/exonuclease/phosphatase family protein [Streptomyces sp. NPDC056190]|uniref:endonuclease/exonuclease/phosphatase family protein n=1 Tax=Streptomyces sp. NPDC056190 TaxID=3345741 RepID=UPI0035D60BCE